MIKKAAPQNFVKLPTTPTQQKTKEQQLPNAASMECTYVAWVSLGAAYKPTRVCP
jgi:hypothetical protein